MGMFDDVAAEHERTKHIPKPTYEEIARAEWDELGLTELAEEYALFARRERIPMRPVAHRDDDGYTPAWVVHGQYGEYDFDFAVLSDGGVLPIGRYTPFNKPVRYKFEMWHNPFYSAETVKRAFLDTARAEMETRDGIA